MKFISFIEEFGSNPVYAAWTFGRIEVWAEGKYAEREIRWATPRLEEFAAFRKKWDFRDVTDEELAEIEREIKARFYEKEE